MFILTYWWRISLYYLLKKKLKLLGLGFKAFKKKKNLWLYQGSSTYLLFFIPSDVWIICKKKKIYILSYNITQFTNFLKVLRYYKNPGRYKSKGLIEFRKQKLPFLYKPGKKPR